MNVRLLVLGMLARQPMHGYQVRKLAKESRIEAWTGVLPGSVYHALKQLTREGLLREVRDRAAGSNRSRTVYAISEKGRVALARLVRSALAEPVRALPTQLYGGLLFREAIPKAEARAGLEAQITALEQEIERWRAARKLKKPMTTQEEALYDNGLEHLEVDLRLLRRLRADRDR